MDNKYEDMLYLPHPAASDRRHMSSLERAAQFAPFAALTGYAGAVQETARLTDAQVELDEEEKRAIDARFRLLRDHLEQQAEVTITYFVPDKRKSGGAYVSATGCVKRFDLVEKTITLTDGSQIRIEEITAIEGELFAQMEEAFRLSEISPYEADKT